MSLENILTFPGLAAMRAVNQWIVYKLIPSTTRPGKTDKIPLHFSTGIPTGVNDPSSWTDVNTAADAARRFGPGHGLGFCFTEAAGFWFVDLDSCYAAGAWSPLAQQVCSIFAGAAIEVSSSGNGLHVFGRGPVPPHASKNAEHHAELYHTDRFVALSGLNLVGDCNTDHGAAMSWFAQTYFPPRESLGAAALDDGPCEGWSGPDDDKELIRRALKSKSSRGAFGGKASFADLWTADADALARSYPDANGERGYDASRADAALAQLLAFWTGKDAQRIERLMRQSKLAREKWDLHASYLRQLTIAEACGQQRDVLKDKRPEPGPTTTATHAAPEMHPVEGSTFLSAEQQAELFKGCVYIVDVHRVLVPGGRLLKSDQFNATFGGYTFAMDARNERTCRKAFEAFTESQVLRAPRADGTCFKPRLPYGTIVTDAGRTRANTWWSVEVPRVEGDASPFLNHLAKLLPDERDRSICLYYMAACVQHQGVKFQWAIVLQGVEGNGKTLLSRCVVEAIGARYVHWPKANKLNGQFNGWMVGKTFFAVEDIHTSENVDVIEALKPMITGGDGLEIEAKGIDQVSAEICGNFMFNTNLANGIRKTKNDRRFCWLGTGQQSVEDLARDGMDGDYMRSIYQWLKEAGGYAIVAEFLWTLEIPDEFNPATGCQRAPSTTSTNAAIEAGLGRVEQEIMEMVERGEQGFAGGWISSIAVGRMVEKLGRGNAASPKVRRRIVESLGYVQHPALGETGQMHHPSLVDGGSKPKLFVLKDHEALQITVPADVGRAYLAAQGMR